MHINADEFNSIFDKMKEADGIVLGLPTYSVNISSSIQLLLEIIAIVIDMNPDFFTLK